MTPKEKARELYDKYWKIIDTLTTKQCALIAVDEVLENVNYFFTELEKDGLPNKFDDEIEYWNEIKKEINKL
jgi:hypothetical protein